MKKNVCLILITLVAMLILSSCVSFEVLSHKSINRLKKKSTIPFSSLPVEVKEILYSCDNCLDIYTCNTAYEYELVNVSWLAWDPHWLLYDKTNDITYRLSYFSNPTTPIIIYDREIFIPTDFYMYLTIRRCKNG